MFACRTFWVSIATLLKWICSSTFLQCILAGSSWRLSVRIKDAGAHNIPLLIGAAYERRGNIDRLPSCSCKSRSSDRAWRCHRSRHSRVCKGQRPMCLKGCYDVVTSIRCLSPRPPLACSSLHYVPSDIHCASSCVLIKTLGWYGLCACTRRGWYGLTASGGRNDDDSEIDPEPLNLWHRALVMLYYKGTFARWKHCICI
jgi:hypothetical protein